MKIQNLVMGLELQRKNEKHSGSKSVLKFKTMMLENKQITEINTILLNIKLIISVPSKQPCTSARIEMYEYHVFGWILMNLATTTGESFCLTTLFLSALAENTCYQICM